MSAAEKSALRRELRNRRRALSTAERTAAAAAVVAGLPATWWRYGRRWAFYLPFGAELDCQALMAEALRRRKQVYLPLILKGSARRLVFARLDQIQGWRRSRLGMLQPVARHLVSARRLDVVCMPLLGFDVQGARLGQGGGYYDSTFAFRRFGCGRPRLLGLAFACQQVERIPLERQDVLLDAVLTEKGMLACATG